MLGELSFLKLGTEKVFRGVIFWSCFIWEANILAKLQNS